jgi:hypothetical protein
MPHAYDYAGHPYGMAGTGVQYGSGQGAGGMPGAHAHGPAAGGMVEMMQALGGGGSFASLGRMLGSDDKEFWKGALVGAAAVLLLTNESVQRALFRTGAKAREAVRSGVEKVRTAAREEREQGKGASDE